MPTRERRSRSVSYVDAQDVLSLSPLDRGEVEGVTHDINTGASPPKHQPSWRVPFTLRLKVKKIVEEMLEAGVVTELNSPWVSLVVIGKKKKKR